MRLPAPGRLLLIVTALVFLTTPLVFIAVALAKGMDIAAIADALQAQYQARRINLLVNSLLALFPVLLLAVIYGIGRRFGKFAANGRGVILGGGVVILLVTVFVNLQFWPSFLPSLVYPGWPHGLEFLLGPAIAAPIAMLLGMVAGGLTTKQ